MKELLVVTSPVNPLGRLSRNYWWVVAVGSLFTLARFSEAFLIMRVQQCGLPIQFAPLVLTGMNLVYAAAAYPFGKLSDHMSHTSLLAMGLVVLIGADLVLACGSHSFWMWVGIMLWGLHMGITQGLLATMVANTASADLRGTAYGFFNLVGGIALLAASVLAGLLWDRFGAPQTFLAGAVFSGVALVITLFCGCSPTPRP